MAQKKPGIWLPYPRINYKRIITFWCPLIGFLSAIPIAFYFLFVEPPPPDRVVIATGPEDGAYYRYARQYAAWLKGQGLELEVMATDGSVENLKLLLDEQSPVSIAIMQSGVAEQVHLESNKLESIGSIYREPLWVFYRSELAVESVHDLADKRLAIGPEGSGTRPVARLVLQVNGLIDDSAEKESQTELLDLAGQAAADALLADEIDAVFLVASIDAPYVELLLHSDQVRLLNFIQHKAYEYRYRYLSGVTIPAGLIDLERQIPPKDIHLLAPSATLVCQADIHPALVPILLEAAEHVHDEGDLLSEPADFPSPKYTEFPLSEDAHRYFESGPPLFQRVFPFWLADLFDRLKLMIIPLLFILMPLVRSLPPLWRWRVRRKIYLWYSLLREIDQQLTEGMSAEGLRETLAKLDEIENQVIHIEVPLSYMVELYHLRSHLGLSRKKVLYLMKEMEKES